MASVGKNENLSLKHRFERTVHLQFEQQKKYRFEFNLKNKYT